MSPGSVREEDAFVPDEGSFRRIRDLATDALWPYSARDPAHAIEAYLTVLNTLALGKFGLSPLNIGRQKTARVSWRWRFGCRLSRQSNLHSLRIICEPSLALQSSNRPDARFSQMENPRPIRTAMPWRLRKLTFATVRAGVAGLQALLIALGPVTVVAQNSLAPEGTRHSILREAMLGLFTGQASIPENGCAQSRPAGQMGREPS